MKDDWLHKSDVTELLLQDEGENYINATCALRLSLTTYFTRTALVIFV